MPQHALVLCYHAISERWRSSMSITPGQLEWQVRFLTNRGYAPVTFTAAACSPPEQPCFAVTFDDAFASVRELGFPLLRRLGVPATVFTPTRFADDGGRMLRWDGLDSWDRTEHARELQSMHWDDLAALQGAGWEIGSHTVSHPRLPDLDDRELADELAGSRRRCEEMLDGPCTAIAYPYGAVDARTLSASAAAGYRAGAALGSPPAPHGNPLEVARVGLGHRDRPWRFAVKTSPPVRALRTRLAR